MRVVCPKFQTQNSAEYCDTCTDSPRLRPLAHRLLISPCFGIFLQRTAPMTLAAIDQATDYLRALPGDDVRQILWRFADRYDLQMLVQSVRGVARGPVARLVAAGARNTHEWT